MLNGTGGAKWGRRCPLEKAALKSESALQVRIV